MRNKGGIEILFASKKDTFYSLIVWGTVIFAFLVIILSFSLNIIAVLSSVLGLLGIVLLFWLWFGTNYRVEKEHIQIKYGPFKKKVTIQDINSISKRKSILATPALSIDRLVLKYGKYDEMLLSPKNEKKFIELLITKNPRIKLDKRISKT